jgi:copper resistance protein B
MADDAMPGMDMQNEHAGHDMSAIPTMQPTGTALPPPAARLQGHQWTIMPIASFPGRMALARRK